MILRGAARTLAAMLGACVGSASLPGCDTLPVEPAANVVIISVDTLRRDYVGAYGAPRGGTPHLDRLARQGTQFADAISTSSWTLPAHMSLLTGQYPSSHGVFGDGRALPDAKRTLAERLRESGYRTAGFVAGPYLHRAYGFDQGFEVYRHCMDYAVDLNEAGRVANVIGANQRSHSGLTNASIHAAATQWLAGVGAEEPFLLFVHYWDPHYDFEPPFPYDRWLDPGWSGRLNGKGFLQNRRISPNMSSSDRDHLLDLYRGEIRDTDQWIGELLRELERRGDASRTIVVATSDHGEEFFEHGNKGHRINLYDESLSVPLLIRFPNDGRTGTVDAPSIIPDVASLVDVVPTVVGLLGMDQDEDAQGVDWTASGGGSARSGVVSELHLTTQAFRSRRWKLVRHLQTESHELYDLRSDPQEANDLAGLRPDKVAELGAALDAVGIGALAPDTVPEAVIDAATAERLQALGYTD